MKNYLFDKKTSRHFLPTENNPLSYARAKVLLGTLRSPTAFYAVVGKGSAIGAEPSSIAMESRSKAGGGLRTIKNTQIVKRLLAAKTKSKNQLIRNTSSVSNLPTMAKIMTVTISSEGPNSLGIVNYLGGVTILVPNTELGDSVKIKIVKINQKIAFGAVLEVLEKGHTAAFHADGTSFRKVPVSVGTSVEVKVISSKQAILVASIHSDSNNADFHADGTSLRNENSKNSYCLIIAQENAAIPAKVGDILQVVVTRIKTNYGFAKIISKNTRIDFSAAHTDGAKLDSGTLSRRHGMPYGLQKLNIILPKKTKFFGDLAIVRTRMELQNTPAAKQPFGQSVLLFIQLGLGAQLGDNVRIKISKVFQSSSGIPYAFAKVIKLNPILSEDKQFQIKQNVEQMLKSGMHFGEKAVQCQAKMRDYIWIRKKGINKNRPFIKKGRHFLNLLKTRRCLNKASAALAKYAVKGRTFLFVGTKKPAASLISRAALFSQKSFFVNTRWLGGMLTNWKTILKSISKIRPILKEKQRIIQMILIKRQGIKLRLMKKILTSMKYIQKGRQFLQTIKTNPNFLIERNNAYTEKRKELIQKGQQLLSKRQQLLEKRKELFKQSQFLKEQGSLIVNKYQLTLTQLINQKQKLSELRNQALLCKEIQTMKKNEALRNEVPSAVKADAILNSVDNLKQVEKSKLIVLSKLLSKFSNFSSYIQTSIKDISESIKNLCFLLFQQKEALKQIQIQMTIFINIKQKLLVELRKVKTKLVSEQKVIKLLKGKIKRSAAEKRFLKFLPKCKHQAPLAVDAANSLQILMQKFVDPKIKQATTSLQIYDDKLKTKSKKLAAARKKKWIQLEKYFGGVANMLKMNKNKISKNVAIIIGQQEEMNAVRECKKLGIQMFHVVDTNCNPTLANHFVPANDDSRHSIKFILTKFLTHIRLAQKVRLRLWKSTLSSSVRRGQNLSVVKVSNKSRMKNNR
jgi:ribosomal protein S2